MAADVTIWYKFLRDNHEASVEVALDTTVDKLKKAIKKDNKNTLEHVDAKDLTIYQSEQHKEALHAMDVIPEQTAKDEKGRIIPFFVMYEQPSSAASAEQQQVQALMKQVEKLQKRLASTGTASPASGSNQQVGATSSSSHASAQPMGQSLESAFDLSWSGQAASFGPPGGSPIGFGIYLSYTFGGETKTGCLTAAHNLYFRERAVWHLAKMDCMVQKALENGFVDIARSPEYFEAEEPQYDVAFLAGIHPHRPTDVEPVSLYDERWLKEGALGRLIGQEVQVFPILPSSDSAAHAGRWSGVECPIQCVLKWGRHGIAKDHVVELDAGPRAFFKLCKCIRAQDENFSPFQRGQSGTLLTVQAGQQFKYLGILIGPRPRRDGLTPSKSPHVYVLTHGAIVANLTSSGLTQHRRGWQYSPPSSEGPRTRWAQFQLEPIAE